MLSCYHDNVIMLSWYRYHVIIYVIMVSWERYHGIFTHCMDHLPENRNRMALMGADPSRHATVSFYTTCIPLMTSCDTVFLMRPCPRAFMYLCLQPMQWVQLTWLAVPCLLLYIYCIYRLCIFTISVVEK
jgi:hypothetical protein